MARLDSKTFPILTEDTIAKLHSKNIFTVYDFMLQTCDDLMKKTGLSFKEIESIRESLLKNFGGEIVNSVDLYESELRDVISTGIENLDNLLEGGLHCRQIYELCGFSSAGKSQLCHWMSMCTTLNASTEVHYIDASKNFCASRIQMMLEAKQCNDSIIGRVMSSIRVHQVYNIYEIFTILYSLTKLPINKNESSKRLVIVDSLSVLCALIPTNELNPILSNLASVCRFLVNHIRAVVVIVNTVRLERGGMFLVESDRSTNANLKPSLGNYWLCIPNVRLLITQLENKRRQISVWKSCQLEEGKECFVTIKDEGILPS